MRVSVCVGNYAETPYSVPGTGIQVYCMEELSYCLKENAFLLDFSLMQNELLEWIERECGLRELAKMLHGFVHKQGSLSTFVVTILQYVGLYDRETICETERILKQGAGLSVMERRKNQIDSLVEKKKYRAALAGYDELLQKWQEQEGQGDVMPAVDCLAAVWHNKGVVYAELMLYGRAAECFFQAYTLTGEEEYCVEFLAAKRMQLPEKSYVAFAAEHGDMYRYTLELEKKFEKYIHEWEQQPDYLRLYNTRELRCSGDRQRYYEDSEKMIQALKDRYRKES